ncbi:MAG: cyclodeaminase/cyclohydrolase family protein [Thermomicrobiales bacterium]
MSTNRQDHGGDHPLPTSDAASYLVVGYAAAVASVEPAPGGGSVAGVVGALAAALVEMVGHLTTGRSGSKAAEDQLDATLESACALRSRLVELAAADEAAYRAYVAATKLPRVTEAEKTMRRDTLQAALHNAADVPLEVATACEEILALLDSLARTGNKHAISDVIVAAMCAEVAARAALLNVVVNARMIKDKERSSSYQETGRLLERIVRDHAATVIEVASSRM